MLNFPKISDTNQLITQARSGSPDADTARMMLIGLHERLLLKLVNHTANIMDIHNQQDERFQDLVQISKLALLEAVNPST